MTPATTLPHGSPERQSATIPPRYPGGTTRARELRRAASEALHREALRAALVAPSGPLRVSWWRGCATDANPDNRATAPGDGRQTYPDLGALADDLRALARDPKRKGAGAVLCGSTFGPLDAPDGEDSPEACGEARRALAGVSRWALACFDHDAGAITLGAAAEAFRAAGVGAVLYPSPSAPGGLDATRWHAHVRVQHDAHPRSPELRAAVRALVGLAECLSGATLDHNATGPAAVAYVAPRPSVGALDPGSVVHVDGGALDLDALGAFARASGLAPVVRSSAPDAFDLDALGELLSRRGAVLGPADARGYHPAECPGARWHSGNGGATSTVWHPGSGAWLCSHQHSAAPDEWRGAWSTARCVRAALVFWREHAAGLDLRPLSGVARELRAELAQGAPGALRVIPSGYTAEESLDAARLSVRRRVPVALRAPVGAGKTRGAALVVATLAPPPTADTRDDAAESPENPRAVAAVLVHTTERRDDTAREVVRAGRAAGRAFLPVVALAVVDALDGEECERAELVRTVTDAGHSARAVACWDTAHRGTDAHRPCPRASECPGAQLWHPWRGEVDGGASPTEGERVRIATHASAAAAIDGLRASAPLVVDEACADPWEPVSLSAEAFAHAARLAPWCVVPGVPFGGDLGAAVVRALDLDPEALALAPEDRAAWCARVVAPRALCPTEDARGALDRWARTDRPALLRVIPRPGRPPARWAHATAPPGGRAGARALAAVRAWYLGARVVLGGDGTPRVLCPKPHTAALAARSERCAGPVLALDATADLAVWRAQTRRPDAHVEAFACDEGAEVSRVMVATRRGGAASLLHYAQGADGERGAVSGVQWTREGDEGAAELLSAAWRELSVEAPELRAAGAGVTRRPLALVLRAWWALDGDRSAAARERAVGAAFGGRDDAPELRALVSAELRALVQRDDLRALRGVLSEWRAAWPSWVWTWWGSTLARGSDALRGVRALVALGDPHPSPDAVSARRGATGEGADEASAELRDAELVQWWGRSRAVQRPGERVALVHVGRVPARDWRGSGARVATVRGEPATEALQNDPRPPTPATPALPPHREALAELLGAGWTPARIGAELRVADRTVRRWWRGETAPTDDQCRALVALRENLETADAVSVRLARVLVGRGPAAVWRGSSRSSGALAPASGLRVLLATARAPALRSPLDAVRDLAAGRDSPDAKALRAGLLCPLGAGTVLDALERVRPPQRPPTAADAAEATARTRARVRDADPPPRVAPPLAPVPPPPAPPARIGPLRAKIRRAATAALRAEVEAPDPSPAREGVRRRPP